MNNNLIISLTIVILAILFVVVFTIWNHKIFKVKNHKTTKDKFHDILKDLFIQFNSSFLYSDEIPFTFIYNMTNDCTTIMITGGKIDGSIKIGIDDEFNIFINSFKTIDNKNWMATLNKQSRVVFGEIKEAETDSVHTFDTITYNFK